MRMDELPQLWNILRGDMSFIGPRPLLKDDQPEGGEARLSVRPGVSGWAQVHGGDALTAEQKLVMDLWYMQHMSLFLDVRILIKTLLFVLDGDKPKLEIIEKSRTMLRGSHLEPSLCE
jgi:lipopolysaccharide/colanic/teichoic acid biosynthesis glycosyltransferase